MTLRKNKQILIILVITLLVSVFSSSVVALLMVNLKEGRINNNANVEAVAFNMRSYNNDTYDSYSEYVISDEYGLTMLAKAVKDYGRNFKGKTVTLTTDLDLGGANFGVDGTFAGTFDGGGYTISNFTINECYRRYKNDVFMIHWFYEYGFFVKLTGTVKNLCLKDYMGPEKLYSFGGIDNDVDNGALHVIIGGFAGTADNGRVENCQSINFKYLGSSANTYRCNTEFYISGVVGAGNVEIINCYVEELNTLSFWDSTRGFQYDREIYVSAFTAGVNIKQDISFGENYKVTSDGFQVTDCVYNDSTPSKLTANETATSVSNCKTETNDVSGLDCNAVGGHSGTTWYHATDYNAGWPQLRVFMKDWKEVTITANPLEYVSMGLSKNILIPSDATKVYSGEIIDNGQEAKIIIYDQEICATPKYGYKFTSWTGYNAVYYVVKLEKTIFKLEFTRSLLQTTSQGSSYIIPYNQNTGEMATDSNLVLEVSEGAVIIVNINVDNNGYDKYEYIITDNSKEIKIVYEVMHKKFQIDNCGIELENNQHIVEQDMIITPIFKLKEYGWIFM